MSNRPPSITRRNSPTSLTELARSNETRSGEPLVCSICNRLIQSHCAAWTQGSGLWVYCESCRRGNLGDWRPYEREPVDLNPMRRPRDTTNDPMGLSDAERRAANDYMLARGHVVRGRTRRVDASDGAE